MLHRPPWRRAVGVLALAAVIVSAAPAAAGPPTDRVREFFGQVNRTLSDPAFEDRPLDRLSALRTLVADIVDFRTAAAVALGNEWRARTSAEREEFVGLFTDLLQTSVVGSVGSRARLDNGVAVTYIAELGDASGMTVSTSVLTRSGGEMGVGYRMLPRNGRWMVHDVVVDGVSLVDNYRAQFQKVIQRSSYAGLVGEMRTRIYDLGRVPVAAAVSEPVPVVTAGALTVVDPAPPRALPRVAEPPRIVAAARAIEPAPVTEPRISEPVRVATLPPPRPTPPAARGTEFWVQIGAFRDTARAMDVAERLRDQAVSLIAGPRQTLLRVLVGPFKDRQAAGAKVRELEARGFAPFVTDSK
jgi:phospholipid transport system substrate-binding protein